MNQTEKPAPAPTTLAIVLAAGEGSRMRSSLPKVLHLVAGRSMVGHVLASVGHSIASAAAIVVGPDRDDVAQEAERMLPGISIHVQRERLGTAHAVLHARDEISKGHDVIIVLFADTPLVKAQTMALLRDAVLAGAAVAALGFRTGNPAGYGRFVMDGKELVAIREHKDASEAELAINLCNAGLMAMSGKHALAILDRIGNANAQKEFYLTDAVEVVRALGLQAVCVEAPEAEVMGVNDRVQLAAAEREMQQRLRESAMRAGVTMLDPASVFLNHDTKFGRDVIVEPHVFFGEGVSIADNAVIHASCHLEGAIIGKGVHVGPFARLRPGTVLGEGVKIGNFVEVKNAEIDDGAKVSHLTYIGDAHIGAGANIGAGTITCNYDGYFKYRTEIGKNAFIGSNSSLVAPVRIADGAYVGSGSVVTMDVPSGALAVSRARQANKDGWATRFNEVMAQKKIARKSSGTSKVGASRSGSGG